ncbi:hypothetical protein B5X24_HaOG207087 [Helicoverpa armigera]|uniref:Uncharacterized protein n=1 Tax=Helicoverpa armigera TaxID=29058 RepID=A0A2W1BNL3_HELAM|nr:hypothetical protein B5X24_HaOG207087 [Helicoverpa armigera]
MAPLGARVLCIISEKVLDALLRVIGGGIGGASSRCARRPGRVCARRAPVCVRLSGHTARLARPAPPRRLIGPSITAAARARALHPAALRGAKPAPAASRLSTLDPRAEGPVCSGRSRRLHRRVNAATRATEIEAYF